MAETLGAIRYDVEVETAGALKGEQVIDKSTKRMEQDFSRVDAAAKKTGTQITKTARAVKSASPNMANFSYQLQDIAVQAQMGINPLVIMTQQLPQMAVGMGGAAASAGGLIAVVGLLAMSLIDTTEASERLEKAIENTKAVMTIGANGVAEYTDEMRELNKLSTQLAKVKFAQTIVEQNRIIKESSAGIIESAEETSDLYASTYKEMRDMAEKAAIDIGGSMEDVSKAVRNNALLSGGGYLSTDLDRIAAKFDITREEALKLGLALSDVANKGDALSIKALQNEVEDLSSAYNYSNPAITKFAASIIEYLQNSTNAVNATNELKEAIFGSADALEETEEKARSTASAFERTINGLVLQNVELRNGERAAYELALRLDGLKESQIEHALAVYDDNEALKAQAKSAEEDAAALKRVNDELDLMFERENIQFNRPSQEPQAVSGTIGMTDEQAEAARLEWGHELLKQDLENRLITEQEYIERRNELYKQSDEVLMQSMKNLKNQAIGTFTQFVVGAQSGTEAMRSLANAVLNEAIGALVQYAIQGVKSLLTVESAEKAVQAANAAQTSTAVGAQVAMTTALAAQNAFAATAAIPITGPAMAPAAATAASAAAGALGAPAVALAPLAGARQFGGPVSAGDRYRVGEGGKPEFLRDDRTGHLSMIPGENGEVIPMDKMGGMQVIINNNAPGVDVSANQINQRQVEISVTKSMQEFARQASTGQGVAFSSLVKNTNVNYKGA